MAKLSTLTCAEQFDWMISTLALSHPREPGFPNTPSNSPIIEFRSDASSRHRYMSWSAFDTKEKSEPVGVVAPTVAYLLPFASELITQSALRAAVLPQILIKSNSMLVCRSQ